MSGYREEQPVRTPWVWALVLAVAVCAWAAFGRQLCFLIVPLHKTLGCLAFRVLKLQVC